MKKLIVTLLVAIFMMNAVTAEAKGLKLKRKPRGVPNSTGQDSKKVEKPEAKTEAAPEAQIEVKDSGLVLKDGDKVEDIRARQKAKREKEAKEAKLFSKDDVAYQPRWNVGCGQYGIKSEAESATRHYDCETGFKLDVKVKDWPVGMYFLGTLQSSPYKEGFVYKNEINYGNGTRQIYGDFSVGVSHDWDYWKTTGELGVGLEKSGISNFKPIYRARLITNPHENLLVEFAALTLLGPRTEATLTVLTNKLSERFFIGLGAGTRSYNDVVRHDRGFVEARYKFEEWAIVGDAEYALGGFGAGGGMKIEIPKFW